jgi:hypothetical protein
MCISKEISILYGGGLWCLWPLTIFQLYRGG